MKQAPVLIPIITNGEQTLQRCDVRCTMYKRKHVSNVRDTTESKTMSIEVLQNVNIDRGVPYAMNKKVNRLICQ